MAIWRACQWSGHYHKSVKILDGHNSWPSSHMDARKHVPAFRPMRVGQWQAISVCTVRCSAHLCHLRLTSPLGEIDLEQVRLATARSHYGLSVSLYESVSILLVGLLPGQWLQHLPSLDQDYPEDFHSFPHFPFLTFSLLFTSPPHTLLTAQSKMPQLTRPTHLLCMRACHKDLYAIKEQDIHSLIYTIYILWGHRLWSR